MIIRTAIADPELVTTLEEMVKDSASRLDMPYKNVAITELDRNSHGRIIIGACLEVDYDNGEIELKVVEEELRRMPVEVLKVCIDHEVSHCKDFLEGIYDKQVFMVGDTPEESKYFAMAMELDKTFSDYFCSKRQIDVFGRDSFLRFHTYELEEFFARTDELMKYAEMIVRTSESEDDQWKMTHDQYSLVFSLFKEYVKSDLIGHYCPGMKEPIIDVSRMLVQCFDRIHDTDAGWIDKSKTLFYTGMVMNMDINLLKSYSSGRVERQDYPNRAEALEKIVRYMEFESKNCLPTLDMIHNTFKSG